MRETKKCEVCGIESMALQFHMKTHDKPMEVEGNNTPNHETIEVKTPKVTLEDISNLLVGINDRLKVVEEVQRPKTATDQIQEVLDEASAPKKELDGSPQDKSIPPQHKEQVENILGAQFEAWQTYEETDSAHFMLHILVPEQLSPISKETKPGRKILPDIRSRAISHAEGVNGVREWCQKVRFNLNQYYSRNALPSPFTEAASV